MGRNNQMDYIIRQAVNDVQEQGLNAPDRAIILAGFSWLADQLNHRISKRAMVLRVVVPWSSVAAIAAGVALAVGKLSGG